MTSKEVLVKLLKKWTGFDTCLKKVVIISAGEGKCLAELKVDEEHANISGKLHGGMSATLVDMISTFALLTHPKGKVDSVTVDINLVFIKSIDIGSEVLIDSKIRKVGGTVAFLDVEILNKATKELLVIGTHTKYLMKQKNLIKV